MRREPWTLKVLFRNNIKDSNVHSIAGNWQDMENNV